MAPLRQAPRTLGRRQRTGGGEQQRLDPPIDLALVEKASGPFELRLRETGGRAKAGFDQAERLVDVAAAPLEACERQPRMRVTLVGGQAPAQDVAQVGQKILVEIKEVDPRGKLSLQPVIDDVEPGNGSAPAEADAAEVDA